MNIQRTSCYTPKDTRYPYLRDLTSSLPEKAGEGPSVLALEGSISKFLTALYDGKSVDGMHPFCEGVPRPVAESVSDNVSKLSHTIQDAFNKQHDISSPTEYLSAKDVVQTLRRYSDSYIQTSEEHKQKADQLEAKRRGFLKGAIGVTAGCAVAGAAMQYMKVGPEPLRAVLGMGGFLGSLLFAQNFEFENLGSWELGYERNLQRSNRSEGEAVASYVEPAEAWADFVAQKSETTVAG